MNEQEEKKKKKKHKKHRDKDREREHHYHHESGTTTTTTATTTTTTTTTSSFITDEHSNQISIEQNNDCESEMMTKSLKIKFKFGQTTTTSTSAFSPNSDSNSVPCIKIITKQHSQEEVNQSSQTFDKVNNQIPTESNSIPNILINLNETGEASIAKKEKKDKKSKKHKHKKHHHKHHKSKTESLDKLSENKSIDLNHSFNEPFIKQNVNTSSPIYFDVDDKIIVAKQMLEEEVLKEEIELFDSEMNSETSSVDIKVNSPSFSNNSFDKPLSIEIRNDSPSSIKPSVPEIKLTLSKSANSQQYSLKPSPQSEISLRATPSPKSSLITESGRNILQTKHDSPIIKSESESKSSEMILDSESVSTIVNSNERKTFSSSPLSPSITTTMQETLFLQNSTKSSPIINSISHMPVLTIVSPKSSVSQPKKKDTPGKGFCALLHYLLKQLQRKDSDGFFAFPVSDSIAPSYSTIISHPMDLSTISKKIATSQYSTLGDFRADVKLMVDNAMKYNQPDTIYYKAASKLWHFNKQKLFKKDALNDYAKDYHLSPRELSLNLSQKSLPFNNSTQDGNKQSNFDNTGLFMDANCTPFTAFVADGTSSSSSSNNKDPWAKLLVQQPFPTINYSSSTSVNKSQTKEKETKIFCDGLTKEQYFSSIKAAARQAREKSAKKRNYYTFITQENDDSIVANIRDDHTKQIYRQEIALNEIYSENKDENVFLNIYHPSHRLATQPDVSITVPENAEIDAIHKKLIPIYGNDAFGLDYALSIAKFSNNSDYTSNLVTSLLDVLTGGKHRTVSDCFNKLLEKKNIGEKS